jgi:hypothetical protein
MSYLMETDKRRNVQTSDVSWLYIDHVARAQRQNFCALTGSQFARVMRRIIEGRAPVLRSTPFHFFN